MGGGKKVRGPPAYDPVIVVEGGFYMRVNCRCTGLKIPIMMILRPVPHGIRRPYRFAEKGVVGNRNQNRTTPPLPSPGQIPDWRARSVRCDDALCSLKEGDLLFNRRVSSRYCSNPRGERASKRSASFKMRRLAAPAWAIKIRFPGRRRFWLAHLRSRSTKSPAHSPRPASS